MHVSVILNGEARQVPEGTTVAGLLTELELTSDRCAVEINREVVPRSAHAGRQVAAGDAIEIVTFVGGG